MRSKKEEKKIERELYKLITTHFEKENLAVILYSFLKSKGTFSERETLGRAVGETMTAQIAWNRSFSTRQFCLLAGHLDIPIEEHRLYAQWKENGRADLNKWNESAVQGLIEQTINIFLESAGFESLPSDGPESLWEALTWLICCTLIAILGLFLLNYFREDKCVQRNVANGNCIKWEKKEKPFID